MNDEIFEFHPDIEAKPTYHCTFLIFKFPLTDEKIEIKIYAKSSDKLDFFKKEIRDFMNNLARKYR